MTFLFYWRFKFTIQPGELNIRQHSFERMEINRVQMNSVRKAVLDNVCELFSRDTDKCPLSVFSGVRLEKIEELYVGANETVRNIRMPVLSDCPWSGVPL